MNKKYEIYFFDVDGTLATSKSSITNEVAESLAKLSQDNKIALITGGKFQQIEQQVINKLPEDSNLNNFYLLPTSGASMYVFDNGKWLKKYDHPIDESRVEEIENKITESFEEAGIEIPKESYGPKAEYRGSQITFSALGQEAPIQVKEKWDPDRSKRKKVVEKLSPKLSDFDVKYGGTTSIDITMSGIDKEFGVRQLTKYLDIDPKNCVFVGDALYEDGNDYSVIDGSDDTDIRAIAVHGPEDIPDLIQDFLQF